MINIGWARKPSIWAISWIRKHVGFERATISWLVESRSLTFLLNSIHDFINWKIAAYCSSRDGVDGSSSKRGSHSGPTRPLGLLCCTVRFSLLFFHGLSYRRYLTLSPSDLCKFVYYTAFLVTVSSFELFDDVIIIFDF